MSIRGYRRRVLVGALTRPDSIGYWVAEQIRMRGNKRRDRILNRGEVRSLSTSDFVQTLTGQAPVPPEIFSELDGVYDKIESEVETLYGYDGVGRSPSMIDKEDAEALYALCRVARPSTVIETGVSDGVSSAIILAALHRNALGRLVSVDFPLVGIPRLYGKLPGWVIPDELRYRWTLFKGQSVKMLPSIVAGTGPIEMFFHDSEHSYDCMLKEFEIAFRTVKAGGVVLSDDAWVSSALRDAAQGYSGRMESVRFTSHGFGGVRKEREEAIVSGQQSPRSLRASQRQ